MYFNLAKLNYSYDALEPYINADIMKLHYEKHYATYCNKLNEALSQDPNYQNPKSIIEILQSISKYPVVVRNNGGGYYNHGFFWQLLKPYSSLTNLKLDPSFVCHINSTYGDFQSLKQMIINQGMGIFGSGWVWLVLDSEYNMNIITTPNQDNPVMDLFPDCKSVILGIDVWEHAYYLQYKNDRKSYLENILNLIDWNYVSYLYIHSK